MGVIATLSRPVDGSPKKKRSRIAALVVVEVDDLAAWPMCGLRNMWCVTTNEHPTTTKEHDPLNGMCISIFFRSFFFYADLNFIAYIVSKLRSTWFQGVRWKPATGPNASYGPWWVFLFFFSLCLCFYMVLIYVLLHLEACDGSKCVLWTSVSVFFFFFFLFVCVFTWC